MPTFEYRPEVLTELDRMGIRPLATTDPELVRGFANDLYRLEIQRLRAELVLRERVEGRKLRAEYSELVVALRETYPVLKLPAERWVKKSER